MEHTVQTLHAEQVSMQASVTDRGGLLPLAAIHDDIARSVGRKMAENVKDVEFVGELEIPVSVEQGCVVRSPSGLALRGIKDFDVMTGAHRYRFDLKVYR